MFEYVYTWASQVVLVLKNFPTNTGNIRDATLTPGSGRSPGGVNGTLLQYSCLKNPMDREAWWATVQRVEKSQTQLESLSIQHKHQETVINVYVPNITALKSMKQYLTELKEGRDKPIVTKDINFPLNTLRRVRQKISKDIEFSSIVLIFLI